MQAESTLSTQRAWDESWSTVTKPRTVGDGLWYSDVSHPTKQTLRGDGWTIKKALVTSAESTGLEMTSFIVWQSRHERCALNWKPTILIRDLPSTGYSTSPIAGIGTGSMWIDTRGLLGILYTALATRGTTRITCSSRLWTKTMITGRGERVASEVAGGLTFVAKHISTTTPCPNGTNGRTTKESRSVKWRFVKM